MYLLAIMMTCAAVLAAWVVAWFLLRRRQAAHEAVLTRIRNSQQAMTDRIIAISHDAGFESGYRMAKFYPERPITFYMKMASDTPGTQQYFELYEEGDF